MTYYRTDTRSLCWSRGAASVFGSSFFNVDWNLDDVEL